MIINAQKDRLDAYIEGVKDLPVTPSVLVKLIALFQQPNHEVDDIVNLMRKDPSLTAEVLRHSNSVYFGHEEPIVDIFEAITRMGFYEVYKTAVAKLGVQTLQVPAGVSVINVQKLGYHSMLSAATASTIAKSIDEDEGLAFTAGLLHDVGKIVLAAAEGAKYGALTKEAGERGHALQQAETNLLGFGHAEVGARLLEQWGLPEMICAPVRHHHEFKCAQPLLRISAVVSLGNIMAHAVNSAFPEKEFKSQDAVRAMEALGMKENDFSALFQEAKKDIQKMAGFFKG